MALFLLDNLLLVQPRPLATLHVAWRLNAVKSGQGWLSKSVNLVFMVGKGHSFVFLDLGEFFLAGLRFPTEEIKQWRI